MRPQNLIENSFIPYSFNGMEKDNEVKGEGNSYTTEYRQYDPRVCRWLSLDPLFMKYTNISAYTAYLNNPVSFVDIKGDSVARFGSFTGNFLGFYDDGKTNWTYQRGYYNEKGVWNVKGKGSFNDAKVDIQAIRNKQITRIEVMSDKDVEGHMELSGVKKIANKANKYTYAYDAAARNGKMDYASTGIANGTLNKNTFYVRESVAFNVADMGNYLFGRGAAELGIQLRTAKLGANINNMVNGERQIQNIFDFGPGTYGHPGLLDSDADQAAIHRGYANSPAGKAIATENEEKGKEEIKSLNTEVQMVKF
jgi:RHS repeat-associated protein